MSRSSENWMVMLVRPWPEIEVIWSMPAIVETAFRGSSPRRRHGLGARTWESAETWIVGKSTLGSDETGSRR